MPPPLVTDSRALRARIARRKAFAEAVTRHIARAREVLDRAEAEAERLGTRLRGRG